MSTQSNEFFFFIHSLQNMKCRKKNKTNKNKIDWRTVNFLIVRISAGTKRKRARRAKRIIASVLNNENSWAANVFLFHLLSNWMIILYIVRTQQRLQQQQRQQHQQKHAGTLQSDSVSVYEMRMFFSLSQSFRSASIGHATIVIVISLIRMKNERTRSYDAFIYMMMLCHLHAHLYKHHSKCTWRKYMHLCDVWTINGKQW